MEGKSLSPFGPTSIRTVRRMLQCAKLKPEETLYDIGSGDGRIVIVAVIEFKARAVGIELDGDRLEGARRKADILKLGDSVRFIHADVFDVDLNPADVVTICLTPRGNKKIKSKLEEELKPGTRVVSLFPIIGWKNIETKFIMQPFSSRSALFYLYQMP